MNDAWPWLLVAAAAAVTYFWRGLGVALSGWIDPESRAFRWVEAVAYALLAGLVSRMIVAPQGPVAATALADRLAAAGLALAVFFLTRRNLLLGTGAGAALLVGLTLARGS